MLFTTRMGGLRAALLQLSMFGMSEIAGFELRSQLRRVDWSSPENSEDESDFGSSNAEWLPSTAQFRVAALHSPQAEWLEVHSASPPQSEWLHSTAQFGDSISECRSFVTKYIQENPQSREARLFDGDVDCIFRQTEGAFADQVDLVAGGWLPRDSCDRLVDKLWQTKERIRISEQGCLTGYTGM